MQDLNLVSANFNMKSLMQDSGLHGVKLATVEASNVKDFSLQ
jgi:hypothetical protein